MNSAFDHWWERNEDLQAIKAQVASNPQALEAMKRAAAHGWNTALELAQQVVHTVGRS